MAHRKTLRGAPEPHVHRCDGLFQDTPQALAVPPGSRAGLRVDVWVAFELWDRRIKMGLGALVADVSFVGEAGAVCEGKGREASRERRTLSLDQTLESTTGSSPTSATCHSHRAGSKPQYWSIGALG